MHSYSASIDVSLKPDVSFELSIKEICHSGEVFKMLACLTTTLELNSVPKRIQAYSDTGTLEPIGSRVLLIYFFNKENYDIKQNLSL